MKRLNIDLVGKRVSVTYRIGSEITAQLHAIGRLSSVGEGENGRPVLALADVSGSGGGMLILPVHTVSRMVAA